MLMRFVPWVDDHWLESLGKVPRHLGNDGKLGTIAGKDKLRHYLHRGEGEVEVDALFNLKDSVLFSSGSPTLHTTSPIIISPLFFASCCPFPPIFTAPRFGNKIHLGPSLIYLMYT